MLISFEGIDGSGKTTQAQLLVQWLQQKGWDVVFVREPGATPLSEAIRSILLDNSLTIDPVAELMLFCAARRQLVQQVLRPALAAGHVVVCDRYADSTLAYQGYGRGLDLTMVEQVITYAIEDVVPGVTFVLDLDIRTALERRGVRYGEVGDRMEDASQVFFERVRQGYQQIALDEPSRIFVLDARQPADILHRHIRDVVWGHLTTATA